MPTGIYDSEPEAEGEGFWDADCDSPYYCSEDELQALAILRSSRWAQGRIFIAQVGAIEKARAAYEESFKCGYRLRIAQPPREDPIVADLASERAKRTTTTERTTDS